jgi:hypothetical protein
MPLLKHTIETLMQLHNCGIVNLLFPPPAIIKAGTDAVNIELNALTLIG